MKKQSENSSQPMVESISPFRKKTPAAIWEPCEIKNNVATQTGCDLFHNIPSANDCEKNFNAPSSRLNKTIAARGHCSRRKADELIAKGLVSVNGVLTTEKSLTITPVDIISVAGSALPAEQPKIYLLLHKPVHTICTLHDPQKRPTVIDLLPPDYKHFRLFPVGRLDYMSEGLLILTNDGHFAQKLMHPSSHVAKTYEVLIKGNVPPSAVKAMREGMKLEDGIITASAGIEATRKGDNTLLTITLMQGLNRQIRRMCSSLGLVVLRLKRIAQGSLKLENLAPGACRELTRDEIAAITQNS